MPLHHALVFTREPQAAFGKAIRELRLRKGLTQEQVAHEAGLALNYVSEMERGRRNPSLVTVFSLASALGVSADALVKQTRLLLATV